MAPSRQNLPPTEEQRSEDSNTSHDPAAQRVSASDEAPPSLPQRQVQEGSGAPVHAHSQPLPQPFYGGQQQQVYVPYTAQPNQQFAYAAPVRPLPRQSTRYLATRLGTTALSSVWGIIIIALTSILFSEGTVAAYVSLYAYAIAAASILWNTAELITYCARLRNGIRRGIHPGAHVGLNLIFWLIGIIAILLTVEIYLGVQADVERCSSQNQTEGSSSSWDDYYCEEYTSLDQYNWTTLPVLRALVAIFSLWTVNHFVLFVLACTDTHKRNALKPAAFVIPRGTVPGQASYFPQLPPNSQPMQYYPYPIVMQPQPAHLGDAESRAPVTHEKQPAQAHQNLAGFYAPAPSGRSAQTAANTTGAASSTDNVQ